MMGGPALSVSPQARLSYLALFSIRRSFTSSASRSNDHFKRSDFTGQGFTGYYEPGQPTVGPLGEASSYGSPKITPRVLKDHLDSFVVGQERAKRVMSVAVYNHYQRVQELQRREDEEEALIAQQERQAMGRHPVEGTEAAASTLLDHEQANDETSDEFPGQPATVTMYPPPPTPSPRIGNAPIQDNSPLTIEKSNVLLLGPSGTGKTLMAKTLARVLEVPFSISDCTPFTQAGYIGEDVEVCIQRLLAAANYDVARAERGIICLDEIDKIATARVSHGKDVSGEGVQQALLKIIEGTNVQIQAKPEKGSGSQHGRGQGAVPPGQGPANSPLSGGSGGSHTQSGPSKGETYNINTDNILFICAGAFTGLHKVVLDRIAKGSIGFGARVRSSPSSSSNDNAKQQDPNDPTIPIGVPENDELFRKHSPFFAEPDIPPPSSASPLLPDPPPTYNTLDLLTPSDLHKYGLIPELTGRLPITTSLRPLTTAQLMRVLTEPRHALVTQYVALFSLSGIELRFSTPALAAIADAAKAMGTGARGLRTVLERVLGDAMFEAPGSAVRFVLVGEHAVAGKERVGMWGKAGREAFLARAKAEEDMWWRRHGGQDEAAADAQAQEQTGTFEQYRERTKIAGSG